MRYLQLILCGVLFGWLGALAAETSPAERLDSLVAPIALYPDPLLAQTLAAATYPLEIIQLHQWIQKNPSLKDQALADAVGKQPWDPSVQALAPLPDLVKRLADDIQWTTDLGNAFLSQQSDVMDAVQRMRQKAQSTGNLKSTAEQKVDTQVVESKQVIVIEQANPEVVYVPSYNPVVVYGPPVYPYPPIYYPPPAYYASGVAISFGVGVAMGAAFWGGGWGWGCGWNESNVNINVNNNFNRVNHYSRTQTGGTRTGNAWRHDTAHRGGAPYPDRATAERFGGATRANTMSTMNDRTRTSAGVRESAGSRGDAGTRADSIGGRDFSSQRAGGAGAFGDAGGFDGSYTRAASSRGGMSMGSRGGMSRGGRR
jgi:hypothetical protein